MMKKTSVKQKLHGIIPPMITPLSSQNELDHEGTTRLINHLLSGGVHGIFLLGTTGEGPSLSERLKREFISFVSKEVSGKVPIVVGISNTSFVESINLAGFCADNNIDAVVITPPFYYPAGQQELIEYFTHLTRELPLPLLVYNMPAMTKIHMHIETVKKIADTDEVIGIKDSSGNMIYYHELLNEMKGKEDFITLIGPEELLAESVIFGGSGGIPGGANVFPKLYVDTYEAARNNDLKSVRALQHKIFILREIYSCGAYSSSLIKGIKCALKSLGICNDFMAEPFNSFGEIQRTQIINILKQLEMK